MDKFFMPNYDVTNVCLEIGIIPTPEDVDKLTDIINGRLDEMGIMFHNPSKYYN